MKHDNHTPLNLSEPQARSLLERYYDGSTTPAEEAALTAYLSQPGLPADLALEGAILGWTAEVFEAPKTDTPKGQRGKGAGLTWRQWARRLSVAAAIAVLATAFTLFISREARLQQLYAQYEGSYVIRDGKKITDISEILPDLLAAEQLSQRLELYEMTHEPVIPEIEVPEPAEILTLEEILTEEIADPQQRQLVIDNLAK
ncbi:MAG: hypothetical protein LIO90_07835 [Bacteroidales bacterium]|nr:hypothetical protein [Bacteroidales bacterium]